MFVMSERRAITRGYELATHFFKQEGGVHTGQELEALAARLTAVILDFYAANGAYDPSKDALRPENGRG